MTARQAPPPAIDLVERAVFLLRSRSAGVWAVQFIGAAPLLIAVLYFFFDAMSVGSDPVRLSVEELICALCFLWFSICRARFAQLLTAALADRPPDSWSRAFDPRMLLIQSAKLFLMPLAVIAIFPIGWATAFFRGNVVFAGRSAASRAAQMSGIWQRQVWAAVAILALVWLVVFLNLLTLVAALPLLVKIFTGAENAFTRLGFALNWTTFDISLAFTWLLLDPLYQAVFCIRAFLAESRETGLDLMFNLRHLAALTILAAAIAPIAHAQTAPRVTPQQLDSSIGKVLQQREYAWHLPRAQSAAPALYERILAAFRPIGRAIARFIRWLGDLFEKLFRDTPSAAPGKPAPYPAVKWVVIALVALLIVAAAFAVVRLTRAREGSRTAAPLATARPIQLDDEQISAADLPEERWMELGRECLTRGDYRLALRAFYLANLSWLGRRELLTIAPFKSNRDYFRELRRRAPAEPVQQAFSENMRAFERAWYGRHVVDAAQVAEFEQTFSRMRNYVEA